MTPTEAAALLTICAAYDNRKPDADAAKAWSVVLDGLRYEDCRDAIVAHYRTSREWIMPADIVTAVRKTRSSRLEDVALSPPPGMDPDRTVDYARWLAETRRAIADGREVPTHPYDATRAIGELRGVVKALPSVPVKPAAKTSAHDERLAEVRAELANREPVPIPETIPPPPPPARESQDERGGL